MLPSSKKMLFMSLVYISNFLLFSGLVFLLKRDSHLWFSEYVLTSYLWLSYFFFVIYALTNS
jgi:hypothetical protein